MRTRIMNLLSTACLAVIASSAFGQGLGYPEAPHHSVSRAARYWHNDGYIARACTGRVGFLASSGCDHKPICSTCDYSRPRHCGCQVSHFDLLGSLTGWLNTPACGTSCGCKSHQKVATQKCATQKKVAIQKCAPQKKVAIQKSVLQKVAKPKCVTPKSVPQKCAAQKCVPQKCAPQKCAPQKCSLQKRPTQKGPTQKGPAQKCAKSCRVKSTCTPGCRTSLVDHIASLDLFGAFRCECGGKCCSGKTHAKAKCKSKGGFDSDGFYGAPSQLPIQGDEEESQGDLPPEEDPAVPPVPPLPGGDVGTGVRSVRPFNRSPGTWRRARTPGSTMPRLLPADNSARDVSRISFEELIEDDAPGKLDVPTASRRLDVFKAASNLEAETQASPLLQKLHKRGDNPLRR